MQDRMNAKLREAAKARRLAAGLGNRDHSARLLAYAAELEAEAERLEAALNDASPARPDLPAMAMSGA